jgi:acyl-CoA synthetase (AMP-forming)/AMP-acid ligase II
VGGNKVHPEEVERVIGSFPGVRVAAVYGKKSPITGQVVAADVVADVGKEANHWKQELTAYCAFHLAAHKVPMLIRIVEEIPVTPAGKLVRR